MNKNRIPEEFTVWSNNRHMNMAQLELDSANEPPILLVPYMPTPTYLQFLLFASIKILEDQFSKIYLIENRDFVRNFDSAILPDDNIAIIKQMIEAIGLNQEKVKRIYRGEILADVKNNNDINEVFRRSHYLDLNNPDVFPGTRAAHEYKRSCVEDILIYANASILFKTSNRNFYILSGRDRKAAYQYIIMQLQKSKIVVDFTCKFIFTPLFPIFLRHGLGGFKKYLLVIDDYDTMREKIFLSDATRYSNKTKLQYANLIQFIYKLYLKKSLDTKTQGMCEQLIAYRSNDEVNNKILDTFDKIFKPLRNLKSNTLYIEDIDALLNLVKVLNLGSTIRVISALSNGKEMSWSDLTRRAGIHQSQLSTIKNAEPPLIERIQKGRYKLKYFRIIIDINKLGQESD